MPYRTFGQPSLLATEHELDVDLTRKGKMLDINIMAFGGDLQGGRGVQCVVNVVQARER
jgi:hypothetical protein